MDQAGTPPSLHLRHQAVLRELSVVEAPRVMYLSVLVFALFDLIYVAMGNLSSPAYYLADLAQSAVFLAGARLISMRRVPPHWVPALFMSAVISNNMATTYQSTIVGDGSLGVIAIMLALSGAIAMSWRPFIIGAAMCVVFTSVVLRASEPEAWTSWAITMITAACMSAVMLYGRSNSALLLARAQQAVEETATADPLTGLSNRRGLAEDAESIIGRARRAGEQYFVAFFDVAGLKQVNDRYGHAVGDQLLVQVSRALSATSRASELLCRRGGDEFLLVGVGNKPEPEALHQRLLRAIDMTELEGLWTPHVWIGTAEGVPASDALERVIMLADVDMYERRSTAQVDSARR